MKIAVVLAREPLQDAAPPGRRRYRASAAEPRSPRRRAPLRSDAAPPGHAAGTPLRRTALAAEPHRRDSPPPDRAHRSA
ncbi:hypothetical protein ABZP36_003308 [Zizania latifolia]